MLVADVCESGSHAIEERLGADEAVVRQHVGAIREMLARAKADLEMQRSFFAEQVSSGNLCFHRHLDLRQERFDQLLLALTQPVPSRTAIEPVESQRVAAPVRSHCQRPSRSWPAPSRE